MAWLIKFTVIYGGTNNRNGSGNIVFIDYARLRKWKATVIFVNGFEEE